VSQANQREKDQNAAGTMPIASTSARLSGEPGHYKEAAAVCAQHATASPTIARHWPIAPRGQNALSRLSLQPSPVLLAPNTAHIQTR
jgi:predicted RNA polymerase sigma factor